MMWPYSQEVEPPAPVLDVAVLHPYAPAQMRRIDARLDTGADLSAIPLSVADELGLLPVRTITAESFDGSQSSIDTYAVTLEIAQARFRYVEVILIPDEYALLGRDILNHFYAELNGPALTFELRLEP